MRDLQEVIIQLNHMSRLNPTLGAIGHAATITEGMAEDTVVCCLDVQTTSGQTGIGEHDVRFFRIAADHRKGLVG